MKVRFGMRNRMICNSSFSIFNTRSGIYSRDGFLYQNLQFRTVSRDYLGLVAQCFDVTVASSPGLECQKALRAMERLQVGVDGNVVVKKKSFLEFLVTNSALVGIQLLMMQVPVPDQRRGGRQFFAPDFAFNIDFPVLVVLVLPICSSGRKLCRTRRTRMFSSSPDA